MPSSSMRGAQFPPQRLVLQLKSNGSEFCGVRILIAVNEVNCAPTAPGTNRYASYAAVYQPHTHNAFNPPAGDMFHRYFGVLSLANVSLQPGLPLLSPTAKPAIRALKPSAVSAIFPMRPRT